MKESSRRRQIAEILKPMSGYTKDTTWEAVERLGFDHDVILEDENGDEIITSAYQARRIQSGESDLA